MADEQDPTGQILADQHRRAQEQANDPVYILGILDKLPQTPQILALKQNVMARIQQNVMQATGISAADRNYFDGKNPGGYTMDAGRMAQIQQEVPQVEALKKQYAAMVDKQTPMGQAPQMPAWWGALGNMPTYQQQNLLQQSIAPTVSKPYLREQFNKMKAAGGDYINEDGSFGAFDQKPSSAFDREAAR